MVCVCVVFLPLSFRAGCSRTGFSRTVVFLRFRSGTRRSLLHFQQAFWGGVRFHGASATTLRERIPKGNPVEVGTVWHSVALAGSMSHCCCCCCFPKGLLLRALQLPLDPTTRLTRAHPCELLDAYTTQQRVQYHRGHRESTKPSIAGSLVWRFSSILERYDMCRCHHHRGRRYYQAKYYGL